MNNLPGLDCEGALNIIIKNAVVENKRERFFQFAKTKKGKEKWIKSLDHFEGYINTDTAIILGDTDRFISYLANRIDMHSKAFALSTQRDYMFGKFVSMEIIIRDLLNSGNGSLVLVGGRKIFCFYLGEDLKSKYAWLVRDDSESL